MPMRFHSRGRCPTRMGHDDATAATSGPTRMSTNTGDTRRMDHLACGGIHARSLANRRQSGCRLQRQPTAPQAVTINKLNIDTSSSAFDSRALLW